MIKPFFFLTLFLSSLFSDPFAYEQKQTPSPTSYIIPPPEYPEENDLMILFLGASYTFWQPYQGGMFLATSTVSDPLAYTYTDNWPLPRMVYRNGFKVNAGINTLYDGWKLAFDYTFFYNHPSMRDAKINPNTFYYYCPWVIWYYGTKSNVDSLSSQFSNTFQSFRLCLNRHFYAGNFLTIAPSIGLLSPIETQHFNLSAVSNSNNNTYSLQTYQKKRWWSIGPYLGIDSVYFFTSFLGLYSSVGGALNFGCHDTSVSLYSIKEPELNLKTSTNIWKIDPMIHTNIGFQIDYFSNIFGLLAKVGWEMQLWFNHNTFIKNIPRWPINTGTSYRIAYEQASGNYSMQGLTIQLEFAF